MGMQNPLLILTAMPLPATLGFADTLAATSDYEVIIISDNMPSKFPSIAKCVHIDDAIAREAGFFNSSPIIAKTPIAWDKAIYYLLRDKKDSDYIWIMEDDVLFTNTHVCIDLIQKYASDVSDLIVRNFFLRDQHPHWPHWGFAAPFRYDHQAGAFLPLCRISRRMVELVRDFVQENGSLIFVEVMFPSLAVSYNLKIRIMNFISERRFHAGPEFRKLELLQLWRDDLENGIFHPVKSDSLRSMSCVRPSEWQLQFSKLVGPFLTRRAQSEANRRATAYPRLSEREISAMIDRGSCNTFKPTSK
jgi:hypothetical protein